MNSQEDFLPNQNKLLNSSGAVVEGGVGGVGGVGDWSYKFEVVFRVLMETGVIFVVVFSIIVLS